MRSGGCVFQTANLHDFIVLTISREPENIIVLLVFQYAVSFCDIYIK